MRACDSVSPNNAGHGSLSILYITAKNNGSRYQFGNRLKDKNTYVNTFTSGP